MSTTPDTPDALEQLAALAASVRQLRYSLASMEATRDAAIRRYVADPKVNRLRLAEALGMSRSRLYEVIDPPVKEDAYGEPIVDDAALERADRMWEQAISRWESAGYEGTPEDHFPLDWSLHALP